jgi:hypothetical protein
VLEPDKEENSKGRPCCRKDLMTHIYSSTLTSGLGYKRAGLHVKREKDINSAVDFHRGLLAK